MNVQTITQALGKHADLVTIEQTTDGFIVKQKDYIQKPTWMEIHAVMLRFKGKWIPNPGATGQWKVPLLKPLKQENHLEVKKGTPETDSFAYDLINEGSVVEGYTLIYLRQIRDLLIDLKAGRLLTEEMK